MNWRTASVLQAAVTVADLRTHLRIDGTDQDSYLVSCLDAAVRAIERYSQQLIDRQQVVCDYWPSELSGGAVWLPVTPVESVESVELLDTSPVAIDGWTVQLAGSEALVTLPQPPDLPVRITAVAGWGTDCPASLRHAVLIYASLLYHADPAAYDPGLPSVVRALVDPWRYAWRGYPGVTL